jgi:DNA-3-methyladenine glycosylase
MTKLPLSFYQHSDVTLVAKALLGKSLFTCVNGIRTGGIITETEAYDGIVDKACHAYNGRRTNRTEIMYAAGGVSYVYLCYGIHHLLNVVTGNADNPQAVLIRSIEPLIGVEEMLLRRNMSKLHPRITSGPGALSSALGIDKSFNATSLNSEIIWLENNPEYAISEIESTPRIRVEYAQEHALWPYRFYLKGNKFVSKLK